MAVLTAFSTLFGPGPDLLELAQRIKNPFVREVQSGPKSLGVNWWSMDSLDFDNLNSLFSVTD